MKRIRPPSTVVLADSKLQKWPLNDARMVIYVKEAWNLTQWLEGICSKYIDVSLNKVIIYFELLRNVAITIIQ